MINTFDSYHEQARKPLSFCEMEKILAEINEEIGMDEDALDLYSELKLKAAEYTNFRAKWASMSLKEQAEIDGLRTAKHDSLITHFNMLARYLKSKGKRAEWRTYLGDPELDLENRKRIGDMGNFIAFVEALHAR